MDRFVQDRRLVQRHTLKTPIRVRIWKSNIPEHRAESVNVSERGIYFATDSPLHEGETVEVLLKMPQEITGQPTTEWRCTGHVVRVDSSESPTGKMGVGVRFDCYEVSRAEPLEVAPSMGTSDRMVSRLVR